MATNSTPKRFIVVKNRDETDSQFYVVQQAEKSNSNTIISERYKGLPMNLRSSQNQITAKGPKPPNFPLNKGNVIRTVSPAPQIGQSPILYKSLVRLPAPTTGIFPTGLITMNPFKPLNPAPVVPKNIINSFPNQLNFPSPLKIQRKDIEAIEIPQHLIIETIFMPKNSDLSLSHIHGGYDKGETNVSLHDKGKNVLLHNKGTNMLLHDEGTTVSLDDEETIISLDDEETIVSLDDEGTNKSLQYEQDNNEIVIEKDKDKNRPNLQPTLIKKILTNVIRKYSKKIPQEIIPNIIADVVLSIQIHNKFYEKETNKPIEIKETKKAKETANKHVQTIEKKVYKTDTAVQAVPQKNHKKIQCDFSESPKFSHKSTSTEDDDFESYFCFTNETIGTVNYKTNENGNTECLICGRTFEGRKYITKHCESHEERSTLCFRCGNHVSKQLKTHENYCGGNMKRVTPFSSGSGGQDYVCEYCGKRTNNSLKHADHLNVHTGERPYKCVCGSEFKNMCTFRTHRVRFGCPHPPRKKRENQPKTEKINRIPKPRRNADPNRYICKECNLDCVIYDKYRTHIKKHVKERNYICPECNNTYRSNHELTNHIHRKHLTQKYKCTICDLSFVKEAVLIHHVQDVHANNNGFHCNYCENDVHFQTYRELRNHKRDKHNVGLGKKEYKRNGDYECVLCNETYENFKGRFIAHFTKNQLHIEKETEWKLKYNIKRYKCANCTNLFDNFVEYAKHRGETHNNHILSKMKKCFEEFQEMKNVEPIVEQPIENCNMIETDNNNSNKYIIKQTNHEDSVHIEIEAVDCVASNNENTIANEEVDPIENLNEMDIIEECTEEYLDSEPYVELNETEENEHMNKLLTFEDMLIP